MAGPLRVTVGAALADRLGVPFTDGDDLHPAANVAKMSDGEALTDDDRWPWLDAVGAWLAAHPGGGVVACSALRRSYRDRLREHAPQAWCVHLDGDPALMAERQAARRGHFMPSSLQASQQAALEPLGADEAGVRVDVALPLADLLDRVLEQLPR